MNSCPQSNSEFNQTPLEIEENNSYANLSEPEFHDPNEISKKEHNPDINSPNQFENNECNENFDTKIVIPISTKNRSHSIKYDSKLRQEEKIEIKKINEQNENISLHSYIINDFNCNDCKNSPLNNLINQKNLFQSGESIQDYELASLFCGREIDPYSNIHCEEESQQFLRNNALPRDSKKLISDNGMKIQNENDLNEKIKRKTNCENIYEIDQEDENLYNSKTLKKTKGLMSLLNKKEQSSPQIKYSLRSGKNNNFSNNAGEFTSPQIDHGTCENKPKIKYNAYELASKSADYLSFNWESSELKRRNLNICQHFTPAVFWFYIATQYFSKFTNYSLEKEDSNTLIKDLIVHVLSNSMLDYKIEKEIPVILDSKNLSRIKLNTKSKRNSKNIFGIWSLSKYKEDLEYYSENNEINFLLEKYQSKINCLENKLNFICEDINSKFMNSVSLSFSEILDDFRSKEIICQQVGLHSTLTSIRKENLIEIDTDPLQHFYFSNSIDNLYFQYIEKINSKLENYQNLFLTPSRLNNNQKNDQEIYFQKNEALTTLSQVKKNNSKCSICNDGYVSEHNSIVHCTVCRISVHRLCYGIMANSAIEWTCDCCQEFGIEGSRRLICPFCLNKGRAMKRTNIYYKLLEKVNPNFLPPDIPIQNGSSDLIPIFAWAHISCALYLPILNFQDLDLLQTIYIFDAYDMNESNGPCCFCSEKSGIYTVKCSLRKCQTYFHPECGSRAGLFMEISKSENIHRARNCTIYCEKHRPNHIRKKLSQARKKYLEEIMNFNLVAEKSKMILEKSNQNLMKAKHINAFKSINFSNNDKKKLFSKIRSICKEMSRFTLTFSKQKRKLRTCRPDFKNIYNIYQSDENITFEQTLDKKFFPWSQVKFDNFSPIVCYYKYRSLIPDEETFLRKIYKISKKNSPKKIIDEKDPRFVPDLAEYCICKKRYDDVINYGLMVGKNNVECSGQNCPGNGWFHAKCVGLGDLDQERLDQLEYECDFCRNRNPEDLQENSPKLDQGDDPIKIILPQSQLPSEFK